MNTTRRGVKKAIHARATLKALLGSENSSDLILDAERAIRADMELKGLDALTVLVHHTSVLSATGDISMTTTISIMAMVAAAYKIIQDDLQLDGDVVFTGREEKVGSDNLLFTLGL